ncbi:MAG: nitroreductase family deazaflavin-dependent oxidoreductase [Actinomycetota bacterium]
MKHYRHGVVRRLANAAMTGLVRLRIGPKGNHLLTTRGCRSGKPHTTPVTIVDLDGERWLVAPYGLVGWVHNARAAGAVTLSRGRTSQNFSVSEVDASRAAPVLKRYVAIAPIVLPYFEAYRTSPVEEFEADAGTHPVFLLKPLDGTR